MITIIFALLLSNLSAINCKREIVVNIIGNDIPDCLQGDSPCSSLDYVLSHLQSGDLVNVISSLVPLHTMVKLNSTNAITIRGNGNTIVMCNNTGGVFCNNCSDVVIEGITWDQCGDLQRQDLYGGINFHTISNLTVQNCTFQHSKLRGLSIFTFSGYIYVVNSYFMHNRNNDTINCGLVAKTGFIHCVTATPVATGGMIIKEAINGTTVNVHIENCTFNNNGHFGKVRSVKSMELSGKYQEIANGVGLSVEITDSIVSISILIENTIFSNNCGRNGAGARLYIRTSSTISLRKLNFTLKELIFYNNSVIKFYISASALMIHLRKPKIVIPAGHKQLHLWLLQCVFYNNQGRRNMIYYVIDEVGQSNVVIKQCVFANNSDYGVSLVELNLQLRSRINIGSLNFINNTGKGAMIHAHVHFNDIMISMTNINMKRNYGYSVYRRGGFIYISILKDKCIIKLSKLNFTNNYFSSNGGGIYILGTFQTTCQLYIQDSFFKNNFGFGPGTVVYSSLTCTTDNTYLISIKNCIFTHNKGRSIVYVAMEYYLLPAFLVINGEFSNNTGTPLELFNVILVGNGNTKFQDNNGDTGGALHMSDSFLLLNFSSFQFSIKNNFANSYGGAIFIEFSLSNVNRSQCHWLLYYHDEFCRDDLYHFGNCKMSINTNLFCSNFLSTALSTSSVYIVNNTALLAGSAVFYNGVQNINPAYRSPNTLDPVSIFYIPKIFAVVPNVTEPLMLATQPNKLQLTHPAECNDDYTVCNITGITLGKDIEIPARIMGYNDKPSEATRFFIECTENCIEFSITGGPIILINNRLGGISITGKRIKHSTSMILRFYRGRINLHLKVIIFPCQLGYAYNEMAKQCYCYTVNNVVSCDANTTIKKGHWFGMIGEQATVSLCPNKYCSFSRTEINSGKYLIHPFHDDQCGVHRTGQACGSCDNGYTLAFDFDDCVNINKCSPGITVVIVVCVLLYWILVIVIILWLMYFRINVGYLYGIVYYYSVVDILLGQILNYSGGFDIIAIMISSVIKLSPRFLGKLCFLQGGMSGIDQYAVHYVHPTGILFILVILSVIARRSQRFALFISRGAIRAICFILILAYTSIADTSLQLFRPLKFTDIRELYTYLSPDIKYFTGRHIVYVIIAIVF